jgi:hypothetical protein
MPNPAIKASFLCPICGCDEYERGHVVRADGRSREAQAYQCKVCSVVFRDPQRFTSRRINRYTEHQYARRYLLHTFDIPMTGQAITLRFRYSDGNSVSFGTGTIESLFTLTSIEAAREMRKALDEAIVAEEIQTQNEVNEIRERLKIVQRQREKFDPQAGYDKPDTQ